MKDEWQCKSAQRVLLETPAYKASVIDLALGEKFSKCHQSRVIRGFSLAPHNVFSIDAVRHFYLGFPFSSTSLWMAHMDALYNIRGTRL
ncbi:hypothetical protein [Pseudomonas sp. S3_H06]